MVVESHPEWAGIADAPMALSYIRFGALSPDFQNAIPELKFGHSYNLSFHLLEKAKEAAPLYQWFALGHLSHVSSDASCHGFLVPTIFSAAPLGMFDFLMGGDDALGESEDIVESFGDMITGDWDALVDVMYDFWLEDEEAKDRAREIFMWYCEEGASFHNMPTDCDQALETLEGKLASAEKFLGGFDREQAKELVLALVEQPLDLLIDLFSIGTMQEMLGEKGEPTPWMHDEMERMKQTALVDPSFWEIYDQYIAMLGPAFTMDRLEMQSAGWPIIHDAPAIVCGNIESVMRFLPEEYDVVTGMIVDEIKWLDSGDNVIQSVGSADAGQTIRASVWFFSSIPFDGVIRGVVRKDRPGFDNGSDEVLGETIMPVTIEPIEYVVNPRSRLEIPFSVDLEGALGFYLELYAGDSDGPLFTTSWDRIWDEVEGLDIGSPLYTNYFGTYGKAYSSLPVDDPQSKPSVLFIRAVTAPAGSGVDSALAIVKENGATDVTGENGIAVFSNLSEGTWTVSICADGYKAGDTVVATLTPMEEKWIDVQLHVIPDVDVPASWWPGGKCLPFKWNATAFEDQVEEFIAWAVFEGLGEPQQYVDVEFKGEGKVCFEPAAQDGTRVKIGLKARYVDGTFGVDGFSREVVIDGSPPVVTDIEVAVREDASCVKNPEFLQDVPPLDVSVMFVEPHSPLDAVEWKVGDIEWQEADWTLEDLGSGTGIIRFGVELEGVAAGTLLMTRVTNAAGRGVESGPVPLPGLDETHLCPVAEIGSVDAAGPPDETVDVPSLEGGGGGCSAGSGSPAIPLSLFALVVLSMIVIVGPRTPEAGQR